MISGAAIRSLRVELAERGLFEHHPGASLFKFAVTLAAMAAAITGIVLLPWYGLFLLPVAAMSGVTAAMTGHEASHGSFSSRKRLNSLLAHVAFPLFAGLGLMHWHSKHDLAHHGHPNVAGRDRDLDLWPMASSSLDHVGAGPFRRWLQRHAQGYIFWPLTLMLPVMMRIESVRYVIDHVRRHGFDGAARRDAGCLAAHYVLWLVVPSLFFGVLPTVALYLALWSLVGLLLALVFAPAHMGLPVMADGASGNRWVHQLETTRNLRLPRWLSWMFVGLDYQVEHHFFPRIPHRHLPAASAITAAWCARHGVRHQSIAYLAGVADVTRFMFEAWRLAPVGATPAGISSPVEV
jgi:fatty acid desaturase